MVTELDGETVIRSDQLYEQRSPLHERPAAQILAIEVQEIEGKENDPVRRRLDGSAERMEISDAVLVLDHHLAIKHRVLAGQLAVGIDHPPIGPRPVIAVAAEDADLTRSMTIRVR